MDRIYRRMCGLSPIQEGQKEAKLLELYLHIPFCARKCSYCDFLSFSVNAREHAPYIGKLCQELSLFSKAASDYEISSVFIGGGTPSVLDPHFIEALLQTIREHYHLRDDAEITIEVNPASTLRYKFASYLRSGINRLSIGLQSANNEELHRLGRIHIFEDFLKCYQGARLEGFQNISIDLMKNIPGQTPASWRKSLKNVIMLKPEHLSLYDLIVEEGTPFYELDRKGELELPDEDMEEEIDEIAKELTEKHGYSRYEISNYARPGYFCRHNYGYWSNIPYLGFGLGASSCFEGSRWHNLRDLSDYLTLDLRKDAEAGCPKLREEYKKLSRRDEINEFLFLGLRRTAGVSEIDFVSRFSVDLFSIFGPSLKRFLRQGLLVKENARFYFTERGMMISNMLLSQLLLEENI
ncbi:putative oxygen-independent coproporphyrinogen III oxidase [Oribacterium sp. oral taxon 078 str. F0263]|uniref:radical SAM family heme chaperone HemW n=1 Tax=Oribacterium sp. oral taxon 078 TaxID=652706 RepID=UPI0003ADCA83|nr:radical SAM family heme chaperone HemW [Oribacterium sp. oral taxon 078]ERL20918.1 putative oxygen-independent coproporphyrinogen III oxidase [Oribacterium sp. oral taxon 078 str. F0263]